MPITTEQEGAWNYRKCTRCGATGSRMQGPFSMKDNKQTEVPFSIFDVIKTESSGNITEWAANKNEESADR